MDTFQPAVSSFFKTHSIASIPSDFHQLPDVSIDKEIIEKTEKALSIPLPVQWNNMGTGHSIYVILEKDSDQNAQIGKCLAIDCTQLLFVSSNRPIVTVGIENTNGRR